MDWCPDALELREVAEHPTIFEGVVDDCEEFSRRGDDGLSGAPALTDAIVEGPQIGRVAHGCEAALDQRGARQR